MSKMADIDEVMYACGLETLHPGGLAKTDEMARLCGITREMKVLDVGSGKGTTACHLARKYGCTVAGLDCSERMIEHARGKAATMGLSDRVSFQPGDACDLPFPDGSFDVVFSECTTTLVDTEKAFAQFVRVLRRGGWVADSDMIWRKPPPRDLADKIHELWEGFTTMTLDGWKAMFERMGLTDVRAEDISVPLPEMEKAMMKELGLGGMAKMAVKLVARPDLRHALNEYRRLAGQYGGYFGYGCVIGRKP